MSAPVSLGATPSARTDLWAALLIGLLTLAWLVFLADGRPEMDPDGARALHVAQNIADGEGQIVKYVDLGKTVRIAHADITKPPLFPALVGLFMLAGLSPKLAGWAVTFIGFAAATSFLYLLSRRVVSRAPALLVAGLFATLMTGVRWGINLHEESLFLALSFAALWLQMGLLPGQRNLLSRQAAVGMLAALAMLTSYQGLPLLISLGVFAARLAWLSRSASPLLGYGGGLIVVGALPLVNFLEIWMSGTRPGFDTVGTTTWYAILSGVVSAWQRGLLGGVYLWLDDGSPSDLAVVTAFYAALLALLALSWRDARQRLLVLYVLLYMALVIVQLGGYGRAYYETRYNMPVETLIVLMALALAGGWLEKVPRAGHHALAVIGLLVLAGYAYAQFNRYQELMANRKGEFCPAPSSIAWIKQHIPAGAVLTGSQCTYQLFAESNAYHWLAIPPARDEETEEKRWSEQDLLAAAERAKSEWVVLMTGKREPLLPKPGYGPFVEGLFMGQGSARVHLETRLPDGLIYRILPQSK